ncbi:hypothetical protein [Shewanella sp.]|uniref:hypothetical protein n=1 Tax=Shewanella sp. TaxID=50422 RepID=UPI003D09A88A
MNSLAQQAMPSCRLYKADQANSLTFEISAPPDSQWYLLSRATPFDAWFSEFLTLTDTQRQTVLEYQGALAKRGQPSDDEYLLLPTDKPLTASLQLSQAYVIAPGEYRISLKTLHLIQSLDHKEDATYLECPSLLISLP